MSQLLDLIWSAVALFVFWVTGGATFHAIEGWSFGNAVYAVIILTLTIGFGDFVPTAPVGRIVWIPYSLLAVPIVTYFAVQIITGLLSTYPRRASMKEAFKRAERESPEAFTSHSDFVLSAHESYGDIGKKLLGAREMSPSENDGSAQPEGNEGVEQAEMATAGEEGALDEIMSSNGRGECTGGETLGANDGGCSAEMFPAETGVSEDAYAESPLTQSNDTDKVAAPPETSAVVPYGDNGKLTRPRRHKPKEKRRHSPSVRLQVSRLIRELRKEEHECPACKKERDVAVEEEKARSEYEAVERIVKARTEDFQLRAKDRAAEHEEEESKGKEEGEDHALGKALGDEGCAEESGDGEPAEEAVGDEREMKEREEEEEDQDVRELEIYLLRQLLELMVRLEAEARQMLLDNMEQGVARTLLLADRNVQIRDLRAKRGDEATILATWCGELEHKCHDAKSKPQGGRGQAPSVPQGDKAQQAGKQRGPYRSDSMLSKVWTYRNTFAEILMVGSMLQTLEGEELNRFERWRLAGQAEEQGTVKMLSNGGRGGVEAEGQGFRGLGGHV